MIPLSQLQESSSVDETCVQIRRKSLCLYRAVDKQARTIDFLLRGIAVAQAFFRKAVATNQGARPEDGHAGRTCPEPPDAVAAAP